MTNNRRRQATDSEPPLDWRLPRLARLRETVGANRADGRAGSVGDGRVDSGCTDSYPRGDDRTRDVGHSDGGTVGGAADGRAYETYADEEYGYRIAYPAGWSVGAEPPGGASFSAHGASDAGAVVFVDEGIDSLGEYVKAFVDDLRADEYVHAFEPATRRDVRLESGQAGQIIECPYAGDSPGETWQLMYLFVVVDGTGYTVGVDWNDADPFGEVAERVVESFVIEEE